MKGRYWKIAAVCAVVALSTAALWQGLQTTHYTLASPSLKNPVRFAVVTDLHSTWYGENQSELVGAIEREHPDAVLLSGDIVDDKEPRDAAKAFLETIAQKYPTYYVLGNHEFRTPDPEEVKDWTRNLGVTVLDGTGETVTLNDQTVLICGTDDPACGIADFQNQFFAVSAWHRKPTPLLSYYLTAPNSPTGTQTQGLTLWYPATHTADRSDCRSSCPMD